MSHRAPVLRAMPELYPMLALFRTCTFWVIGACLGFRISIFVLLPCAQASNAGTVMHAPPPRRLGCGRQMVADSGHAR
jgi:hypothetical protein